MKNMLRYGRGCVKGTSPGVNRFIKVSRKADSGDIDEEVMSYCAEPNQGLDFGTPGTVKLIEVALNISLLEERKNLTINVRLSEIDSDLTMNAGSADRERHSGLDSEAGV